MHVATLDDLERDVDNGPDPDRGVLAFEFDVEERLWADGLPLELGRVEPLAVAPPDLAQDAHRRVGVLVVERQRAQEAPQADHDLVDDGRKERVEELLRQVVDAQLEGAQALADELAPGLKSVDKGPHEVRQVGEEDREADGDGEDELGKEVLARLVGRLKEGVELLEERLEQGEDLVVQDLEAAAADRPEEGAQEEVVRVGLGRLARELERVHDEVGKVRQEDGLVLLGEDRDGHERHLVQAQHDARVFLVVVAEVGQARRQESEQDGDKVLRHVLVREERLRDDEQLVVLRRAGTGVNREGDGNEEQRREDAPG